MDAYKQQLFLEAREKRSSVVTVQIYEINEITKIIKADVLNEEGKTKYHVLVNLHEPLKDECGCQSFYHGNTENYRSCNGDSFKCKHLLKLRLLLGGYQ